MFLERTLATYWFEIAFQLGMYRKQTISKILTLLSNK